MMQIHKNKLIAREFEKKILYLKMSRNRQMNLDRISEKC